MQDPNYKAGLNNQRGTFTDIYSIAYRTGVRDREARQKPLFPAPAPSMPVYTAPKPVAIARAAAAPTIYAPARPNTLSTSYIGSESYADYDYTPPTSSGNDFDNLNWFQKLVFTVVFWGVIGVVLYGGYRLFFSSKPAAPATFHSASISTHPRSHRHHHARRNATATTAAAKKRKQEQENAKNFLAFQQLGQSHK